MALQPDIQYVPFYYVDGSTARKLDRQPDRKKAAAPAPKQRRAKRKVIAVDPLALIGTVVAVVLFIAMVVGFVQYNAMQEKNRQMSDYVTSLQLENDQLQQIYRDNIDLDYIQKIAESIGMVPAEDAEQIQIQVQIPQEESVEMGFWESITTFLAGLFA